MHDWPPGQHAIRKRSKEHDGKVSCKTSMKEAGQEQTRLCILACLFIRFHSKWRSTIDPSTLGHVLPILHPSAKTIQCHMTSSHVRQCVMSPLPVWIARYVGMPILHALCMIQGTKQNRTPTHAPFSCPYIGSTSPTPKHQMQVL